MTTLDYSETANLDSHIRQLELLHREAVDAFGRLEVAKHARDTERAYVLVNDASIDGRNAEVREAQLILALNRAQTWRDANDAVHDAEATLALLKADLEVIREKIRYSHKIIDIQLQGAQA